MSLNPQPTATAEPLPAGRGLGRRPGWRWLVGSLLLAALVSAGCGGDESPAAEDRPVSGDQDVVLPTEYVPEPAPPEEQAAAEAMLADAMADGIMTAEEFEAMALEAVECTRRAGFEASMDEFIPETRTFSFSIRSAIQRPMEPGEEDPAIEAYDSCEWTFFNPAYDAFDRTNPRTEEDVRLGQERREQALIDCMRDAGSEIETFDDFMGTEDVPPAVHSACAQAYNS